jgi:hypothetical protein
LLKGLFLFVRPPCTRSQNLFTDLADSALLTVLTRFGNCGKRAGFREHAHDRAVFELPETRGNVTVALSMLKYKRCEENSVHIPLEFGALKERWYFHLSFSRMRGAAYTNLSQFVDFCKEKLVQFTYLE